MRDHRAAGARDRAPSPCPRARRSAAPTTCRSRRPLCDSVVGREADRRRRRGADRERHRRRRAQRRSCRCRTRWPCAVCAAGRESGRREAVRRARVGGDQRAIDAELDALHAPPGSVAVAARVTLVVPAGNFWLVVGAVIDHRRRRVGAAAGDRERDRAARAQCRRAVVERRRLRSVIADGQRRGIERRAYGDVVSVATRLPSRRNSTRCTRARIAGIGRERRARHGVRDRLAAGGRGDRHGRRRVGAAARCRPCRSA